MRTRRPNAKLCLVAMLLACAPVLARKGEVKPAVGGLELHENLQRDPLLVIGMWLENPADGFAGVAGLIERFTAETVVGEEAAAIGWLSPMLAETLGAELLPRVGPEIAIVVDLPAIDEAVAALQFSKDDALSSLLSRMGVVARVRDGGGLERAVRDWVQAAGGEIADMDGLTAATVPLGSGEAERLPADLSMLRFYYGLDRGRWVAGFSAEWVRAALQPRPKGQRLIDGDDFKKVFAQLDARPTDLVYVNLPRLRALIAESQVIQLVLRSNTELRDLHERFFTGEAMGIGLGATSVRVEGGVRSSNFGPPWMSGTAVSGGYMAALALPKLLTTVDRGKTHSTVTDLRAIAQACEGFSTDSRVYPGPTEGWVPVDKIAAFLEPVYIGTLPRNDGWENPILYWSDGGSYRILSTGRDGRIDRDWTDPFEPDMASGVDSDIVFGDGRLLAWPAGMGAE